MSEQCQGTQWGGREITSVSFVVEHFDAVSVEIDESEFILLRHIPSGCRHEFLIEKAVAVVFAENGVQGTAEFSGIGDDKRSDQSTDEFSGTVRFTAPVAGSPAMPARTRR